MLSFSKSILLKSGANLAVLSLIMGGTAAAAGALPSSGHFVSGQGQIGKAGRSLTVKQSSTTGIINWNGFSVGKNSIVSFDNGNGATLNRITGGNLSTIAGQLHATGSLYLMNNSGVIVSRAGHVVTGGSFVATSSNVVNSVFDTENEKRLTATAAVVNRGTIIAGGGADLLGRTVTNTGSIAGRLVTLRGTHGVDADGTIDATGSTAHKGRIVIIARSGETKITGALTARNADGTGGHIETSGRKISIAGRINAGNGGTWLVDPKNLVVDSTAASTIDSTLESGTDVTLKTEAHSTNGPGIVSTGKGDIVIDSALSWDTAATLTLDAYHSIAFAASLQVNGKGKLDLMTNDGGAGGELTFNDASATFEDESSDLTINGVKYDLINNLATLSVNLSSDHSGHFALTQDLTAQGTFFGALVQGDFRGVFEGLGHTISDLLIDDKKSRDVGLFSENNGTIRDIGLLNARVEGSATLAFVGTLAGVNSGTITASYATGKAIGDDGDVGGLVGAGGGLIENSYANVDVGGTSAIELGGLAGDYSGSIMDSYATGRITGNPGSFAGGLVGILRQGIGIAHSYATGNVSGGAGSDLGGLVGFDADYSGVASISHSYATGKVVFDFNPNAEGGTTMGGLVGENGAIIVDSYATGAVIGTNSSADVGGFVGYNPGIILRSYATGNVSGSGTAEDNYLGGGFVGYNDGTVEQSYSMGAVKGDADSMLGGFAGENDKIIDTAYTSSTVTGGAEGQTGGFVGYDDSSGGISKSYWDLSTGLPGKSNGAGNIANDHGIEGKTTAQLQAALPNGFKPSVWAIDPEVNNGLPYLIALTSSY